MRVCTKCNQSKALDSFNIARRNPGGYNYHCKTCVAEIAAKRQKTKKGVILRIYNGQLQSSKERAHNLPDYSKQELLDWLINDPIFLRLYTAWCSSGYQTELKPSCDRKDDMKNYTLSNLSVTTWDKNRNKHHQNRRDNKDLRQCKAVRQLTLSGEYIATFRSMWEASRNTPAHQGAISEACNGHNKTAGGFQWEYV